VGRAALPVRQLHERAPPRSLTQPTGVVQRIIDKKQLEVQFADDLHTLVHTPS